MPAKKKQQPESLYFDAISALEFHCDGIVFRSESPDMITLCLATPDSSAITIPIELLRRILRVCEEQVGKEDDEQD